MTPEAIEYGRKLFAQSCNCLLAAAAPEQFPPTSLPEIAFIGRSNVGKSSLINGLTGRKNLARSSVTPGRTQQVVFFDLAQRLMMVDLPGYGHAEAPKAEKERWNNLVQYYLKTRPQLKCVFLLIDARHRIMDNDITMMKFMDRMAVSYQIVLTKADQIRSIEHDIKIQQVLAMLHKHPAARPHVYLTSAEKAVGIDQLRAFIADFVPSVQKK